MKRIKKVTTVVVALLLAVAVAAPAHALVSKSGTQSCGPNQLGRSYGLTIAGMTYHYPPGDSRRHDFKVGNKATTTYATANKTRGGAWKVSTEGAIHNSGTYATCIASGQP